MNTIPCLLNPFFFPSAWLLFSGLVLWQQLFPDLHIEEKWFHLLNLWHFLSIGGQYFPYSWTPVNPQNWHLQYCAKVTQAKCANFVLFSRDFSTKVRMKFHGESSDNLLEQRAIFLRSFVQLKKICEHKRWIARRHTKFCNALNGSSAALTLFSFSDWYERSAV